MTIQTIINDGLETKTRTYRKVYRMINYDKYLRGFRAQSAFSRWGEMWQLKGDKRILLATFGGRYE